ncbi:YphA family membrane protein [Falsibacillus pallidus]|uniref:YphA family membrane protein n=1 Tax=Falsibacillus pallidus TaxID=493781 RepID=UPI003D98466F
MHKHAQRRLSLSILSLGTIAVYPYVIEISPISFQAAAIVIFLFCMIEITAYSLIEKLRLLIYSLTICAGTGGFMLMKIFDPVWVIFDSKWMLSLFLFFLIQMITPGDLKKSMLSLYLGLFFGHAATVILLNKWGMDMPIGSPEILDIAAYVSTAFLALEGMKVVSGYFEAKQNVGKGKQG